MVVYIQGSGCNTVIYCVARASLLIYIKFFNDEQRLGELLKAVIFILGGKGAFCMLRRYVVNPTNRFFC